MIGVFFLALVASPSLAITLEEAGRPVTKVITLLKEMVEQLEKEAKEDEEVYEAMSCWCETNDKAKTKAIADGEQAIADLTAAIEGFTALSSKLTNEIGVLEKEVADNKDALEKATGVRKKEMAEFNAEESGSLQTISSLKGAVAALAKRQSASFLQTGHTEVLKSVAELKDQLNQHQNLLKQALSKKQRKSLSSFLDTPEPFLASEGTSLLQVSASAPSDQIFGLLKQMKEDFETNLAASQKEELKAQGEYEDVKKGKTEEVAAGESQIETKTQELADSDEKNAISKETLEETRATLAADTEFLANLKEQCKNVDAEYEERTKTRQMEIGAVSKALAFLSSDEAKDLVARSLGFIQKRSSTKAHHHLKAKVAKLLSKAASKFQDPRFTLLAVSARLDAFTKVKKSITDMIDTLVKEKEDEIEHKDFCVEEINTNEKQTQEKDQIKNTLEEKIADLAESIVSLKKLQVTLKAEVGELQVELKRAGEDREKANSEFQTTVADQRATQKLLAGALNILKSFYDKAALVQQGQFTSSQEPAGPPPPPGFKKAAPNAQSGGVMAMIEAIIADAKAMESDALKAEEEGQIAFETFVTDTNMSIESKTKEGVTAAENQGKAESEKVEKEMERDGVVEELDALAGENADLHASCDFTLKNFDVRQAARDNEIEALKQALSLLSGASFGAFLQPSVP
jgi:chromosome segregation ATPase